jgi:protein-L-isoaspartate(D-aspartate) O-methyltransferase
VLGKDRFERRHGRRAIGPDERQDGLGPLAPDRELVARIERQQDDNIFFGKGKFGDFCVDWRGLDHALKLHKNAKLASAAEIYSRDLRIFLSCGRAQSPGFKEPSLMESAGVSPLIEKALAKVVRADFVAPHLRDKAEEDRPLPIGLGQTTPQPSLVAYMTEQLGINSRSRVLEIGTGCGYQTAILAELADMVYTVECSAELATSAEERLRKMGYRNIAFRLGDGSMGWVEAAPFDAIIVTAAGRALPATLVAQLKAGGRLIAPVGDAEGEQTLVMVETKRSGEWLRRDLCPVWFVPLVSASL